MLYFSSHMCDCAMLFFACHTPPECLGWSILLAMHCAGASLRHSSTFFADAADNVSKRLLHTPLNIGSWASGRALSAIEVKWQLGGVLDSIGLRQSRPGGVLRIVLYLNNCIRE